MITTLFSLAGWRLFDDSTVTTVDESQVVTRYAYVLFYRRRNSPVERPPRGLAHPSDPRADLAPSAEAAANQVRAPRSHLYISIYQLVWESRPTGCLTAERGGNAC